MYFPNNKDPFSFMNQDPNASLNHLGKIKEMMDQFNQVFGDDFWNKVYGMNQGTKRQQRELIPVEIWEGTEHLFLSITAPWLRDTKDALIEFNHNQSITIKAKPQSVQPPGGQALLYSELPRQKVEKQIKLPYPVNDEHYSTSYENGVLTVMFEKIDEEKNVHIPFNF